MLSGTIFVMPNSYFICLSEMSTERYDFMLYQSLSGVLCERYSCSIDL